MNAKTTNINRFCEKSIHIESNKRHSLPLNTYHFCKLQERKTRVTSIIDFKIAPSIFYFLRSIRFDERVLITKEKSPVQIFGKNADHE
jgi:hypothetical protein